MADDTFQDKLEELQQRFDALLRIAHEDRGQVGESLPGRLAELQHSLGELQTIAAEVSANGSSGSAASAPSTGKRTKDVPLGRGPRFRAMAERGPVLVRIMRTETRCRWANRAWLEFTGRSMKQLLEEGWLQCVHPEDRGRCIRPGHEAFEPSRLDRMEYRLQRKDGEYGWVLEIGIPHLTSRGIVGGYLGTAIEITEHKQAEARLTLQYAVARVLSEARTLEEAAAPILRILCETLGWDVGELWSIDNSDGLPHCARLWASPSVDASGLQEGLRTRAFPPAAGSPWQSGRPLWIADIAADETLAREPEARRVGLHGMFRLPISLHGEVCAILRLFSRGVRREDAAVAEFMVSVGVQIGQFLERQRSVERIRESEARKAAILESTLDAVITIDHRGQVLEFNSAAEAIFGYRRQDAVGRVLVDLIVPPRMREQALADVARYRATGECEVFGKRFGAFAMKANGSEFPVEVAITAIGIGGQPLFTIYVSDATARRNAEQEVRRYQGRLRELMTDLLLVEEHERRRLASDLHDGLSQTIALTKIKLSALRLSIGGRLTKPLDEIDELIEQANRAARSISFELSPPVLHDLGLAPAVHWLVENIQARYGIEIVLVDDGQPKPADDRTRVILFRSIRELLINAAKHAGARKIHVCLRREEDLLNAAVEDDGVGMALSAPGVKGSGLISIRERLSHVGGSMQIESVPGKGTRVHLCAPLTNNRPTKARLEA